jgi:DNA end-binding protein Ku
MATARALKSTSVKFGMVNIPLKLYKSVDSHDVSFKQHHAGCGGSIKMERYCEACEVKPVPFGDVIKGIDHDGTLVLVTADEIKALESETPPAIEVVQFVDAGEIDPLTYESAYYAAPDKTSLEGYTLLRTVLAETGRVGVVRFSLRAGRHSLGVLRASGDLLIVHTVAWPDEVREPAFPILDKPVELKPAVLDMAHKLVDSMTGSFKPEEFVDTYTDRVKEFIAARAEGGEFIPSPAEAEDDVSDLLAALEASIVKKAKKKAA